MRSIKKSVLLVFVLIACVSVLVACAGNSESQQQSQTGGEAAKIDLSQVSQDDPYVSDEACMSCHGGTYEAIAKQTADYGDSNPHDSVHGGYLTCDNCHAKGNEVTENQCESCHVWPRQEQSVLS